MSLLWDLGTTVGGVLIALFVQHYWHEFNRGDDRRRRRRETLEKLAMLAFEQIEYLRADMQYAAIKENHNLSDRFSEFWILQQLYFQELNKAAEEMHKVKLVHGEVVSKILKERTANPGLMPSADEWLKKVHASALKAHVYFLDECRRLIKEDEAWLANTWRRGWKWLRSRTRRQPALKPVE